jgi:serine/threonine-protein kinase
VGPWRVVERLGVGGNGAVYRVEDMACPGDFYALKIALRPEDERADREAQMLMSRAVHPNVVRLHALGRWPHPRTGYLYFVMDWVPGLALHTWVETVNPSFRQLAEKAGKVALALGALHDKGVLHRDFKPEHVVIREKDGEPILLDFGVGRYSGADTVTTAVLPPATMHLLSPEAVHFFRKHYERPGARYEARAGDDLYALGVSLYRVVTGHWPFSPELPPDMLYAAIEDHVPPAPAALNRRVPRALSQVILRLLAKKPAARFQTGRDVHAALVAAVALGGTEDWERTVFPWEDVPEATSTDGEARRRIRLPEAPTASRTPPARTLVLGLRLPLPGFPARRPWALAEGRGASEALRPRGLRWGAAVGLMAVLALGVWGMRERGGEPAAVARTAVETLPGRLAGQNVAQQVESPETVVAAAPPPVGSTPAAVAPATHTEAPTAVKTMKTAVPATPAEVKTRAPRLRSVSKALCMGAASATLACSSTEPQVRQVRPNPPPEDCPRGAEEAMEKRGVSPGMMHGARFPGTLRQVVFVREGYAELELIGDWREIPHGTRLVGRFIFANGRVYARLTEAHISEGERIPVCMVLYGTDTQLGLVLKPGATADSGRVFSAASLVAVYRFE